MILIWSGTKEGLEIKLRLIQDGFEVGALTTEDYGQEQLDNLINTKKFDAVIDVSHPSSNKISDIIKELCALYKIFYIRYTREETKLPENTLIHPVNSWEEATVKAYELGKNIFLTTGSNNLGIFLNRVSRDFRVVVRVLPDHNIIRKCQDLGIATRDIVAMQGPFSREMNKATFKAYKASVVVTKDSGKAGGTDTKISAALALKIPVVVIKSPPNKDCNEVWSYCDLLKLLKKCGIKR